MIKNEDIKKVENIKFNEDTYTIRWNVTKICNYNCDFCIQGNRKKHLEDSKGESYELRKKICDNIIEFIETKINKKFSKLRIYLIGGEVTILKEFIEILEKFSNCKFEGTMEIHITTNLSCSKKTLEKIKTIVKENKNKKYIRNIEISASYYKQFTTEKEFIRQIKTLRKNNLLNYISKKHRLKSNFRIKLTYPLITDEDYKKYLIFKIKNLIYADGIGYIYIRNYKKEISPKLKEKLSKKNKTYRMKVTMKNNEVYYFKTPSEIKFLTENNEPFNPYGMICDTGIYNISISNVGVISRCPSCSKKTEIGSIFDKNIDLITKPTCCPSYKCDCSFSKKIERK